MPSQSVKVFLSAYVTTKLKKKKKHARSLVRLNRKSNELTVVGFLNG